MKTRVLMTDLWFKADRKCLGDGRFKFVNIHGGFIEVPFNEAQFWANMGKVVRGMELDPKTAMYRDSGIRLGPKEIR